jgi:glycosyltransferase involved in cell wall biosynthesis
MSSILFVSHHCYLDFVSGAALAARDLLVSLTARGWEAQVLCGSQLDMQLIQIDQILAKRGTPVESRRYENETSSFSTHDLMDAGVAVRVYEPAKWSRPIPLEVGYPFIQLLDQQLQQRRPDLILTFGGGWLERGLLAVARRHGVPVVFWLRNTEYKSPDLFGSVAGVIVPSRFSAEHHKKTLNLDCQAIPSLILRERVLCEPREPRCVTFVSPMPSKGVFYFARIASELGRRRPDIPMLIAVGRGETKWLDQTGLNLRGLPNLKIMPATDDPRNFFRLTRVVVAPSLWQETFLRVAVEGMFNGIPTLASRRGGVPDTLGQSGFLFDIAFHHTTESRRVPTVHEVTPWVDTLARLFDDPQFESQQRQKCLAEAERFMPKRIIAAHEEYLRRCASNASKSAKPMSKQSLASDLAFLQRFFKTPMNLERFPAI